MDGYRWASLANFSKLWAHMKREKVMLRLDEAIAQRAPAWSGLARYIDDNVGLEEYAKVTSILKDCPEMTVDYFLDVAGKVDDDMSETHPQWGIDIKLAGGTLTYGPWSDKQRYITF